MQLGGTGEGSSDNYHCLWADKPGLSMTRVDEAAEVLSGGNAG